MSTGGEVSPIRAARVRWPVLMTVVAVAGVAACSSTAIRPTRVGTASTRAGGLTVNLASYQAAPLMLRVGQSLVVNCRDLRAPIGATCARGPVLDVKVTAATSTGTVIGNLVMEGGAAGVRDGGAPPERPLSGLVKFVSNGRQVAAVTVGANGLFTIRLAAGAYRVDGCTPQIQGVDSGGGDVDDCAPPIQTLVRARVTTAVPIRFIVP